MMAAMLALASAATFGVADFLGGVASRRAHALVVAALSQAAGLVVLAIALPALGVAPQPDALLWGLLAGVGGAGGLAVYLHALSTGPMGVTAPVAAVAGGVVPLLAGLAAGEQPSALAVAGIAVGIVATALVSRPADADAAAARAADPSAVRRGVLAALAAGALFGVFFIALDRAPDSSGLWPLLGARAAGLALLGGLLAQRRPARPGRDALRIGGISGVLDMGANILFLLATRTGLLAVVSVLASLYPVGVVLLARTVLDERLGRVQWAGVGLALLATGLIAA